MTTTPTPTINQQAEMQVILTIDNKTYFKNGVPAQFDVAPYIDPSTSRTMVPIRFIAEAFGASVSWVDSEQTDYITLYSDTPLKIPAGQPLPNDMGIAVLIKDRLFVPIRYVSEQLGAKVNWDAAARTVTITMNNSTDNLMVGGYTSDRAVTNDDLAIFNDAMIGTVGVNYTPTLVATQVVNGTNYRFTATAAPVDSDTGSYKVYIYIYKPLQGMAQLTQIVNS